MADRTVKITIDANVTGLQAKLKAAQGSVNGFSSKLSGSLTKNRAEISQVSSGLMMIGGAALAAVGVAVAKFAEFDAQMSEVQAATHESAANMGLLREAALQAGADTKYSATEAAAAVTELAKAGISTADVLSGGLKGSLDLAAAGGLDVGSAAEIAATALTQFKLKGSDVGHVADLLAAGAGKAQGDVSDLGMALKQSGLVASQTGLSIEETTGALSAFAAAGLLGSDAGTSLKSMLQRLTPQSQEAKAKMEELGISAYDAQGKFIGLSKFAGNLQNAMKDLTPEARNAAMATIFGADAVRAASVLYDEGADGVQGWIDAVDDTGYAAETAAAKTDNLKGDLERLGGSFETAAIKAGEAANGGLRSAAQAATNLLDAIAEHPNAAGNALMVVGALGALALTAGGVMKATVALNEFNLAAKGLGLSGGAITKKGLAIAGSAAAIAGAFAIAQHYGSAFQGQLDSQKLSTDAVASSLEHLAETGEYTESMNRSLAAAQRETQSTGMDMQDMFAGLASSGGGFLEYAETATSHWAGLTGILEGSRQAIGQIDEQLSSMDGSKAAAAFKQIRADAEPVGTTMDQLLDLFPQYRASLESSAASMGVYNLSNQEMLDWMSGTVPESVAASEALAELGFAHVDAGASADEQRDALMRLMQAQQQQADIAMAAANSQVGYAQSLDNLKKAAEQGGIAINETTGKIDVFANESSQQASLALTNMAGNFQKYANDAYNAGASTEELTAMTQSARDEFVQAATQMGLNSDQANALADSYGLIPGQVVTSFDVPGADSSKVKAEDLYKAIDRLPESKQSIVISAFNRGGVDEALNALASVQDKTVTIYTAFSESNRVAYNNGTPGRAEGGAIWGPGTATSDSILARLSNGEFVIRTWAAQQIGYDKLAAMNQSGMTPTPGKYASGGLVVAPQVRREAPLSVNLNPVVMPADQMDHYLHRAVERVASDLIHLGVR